MKLTIIYCFFNLRYPEYSHSVHSMEVGIKTPQVRIEPLPLFGHSHSDKIKTIELLNTAEMNAAAQANYALLQSISDRCNFK